MVEFRVDSRTTKRIQAGFCRFSDALGRWFEPLRIHFIDKFSQSPLIPTGQRFFDVGLYLHESLFFVGPQAFKPGLIIRVLRTQPTKDRNPVPQGGIGEVCATPLIEQRLEGDDPLLRLSQFDSNLDLGHGWLGKSKTGHRLQPAGPLRSAG